MKDKNANNGNRNEESVAIPRQELEELRKKAEERDKYYNDYLRAHADSENMRKRMEKERSDLLKYANEGFILDFLPIADNLEISEKHIKEAKDFKAVQEGVDMIQAQIQKFLKDIGVERIKTVGEKFDPHVHEVVESEESEGKDDGIIIAELKPGYMLNGRLLRPASVKIVKKKQE
ncbi:MAG: nucleotide exchange factor GrpE [Candidatus Omnitrophica bacterium]|nr:nucleotide exchange factor GrpE [Candidatus Omnitrophota bacterium]